MTKQQGVWACCKPPGRSLGGFSLRIAGIGIISVKILKISKKNPRFEINKKKKHDTDSVYLKCHFAFLDKLKYEIGNKVLIFVSILKLTHAT